LPPMVNPFVSTLFMESIPYQTYYYSGCSPPPTSRPSHCFYFSVSPGFSAFARICLVCVSVVDRPTRNVFFPALLPTLKCIPSLDRSVFFAVVMRLSVEPFFAEYTFITAACIVASVFAPVPFSISCCILWRFLLFYLSVSFSPSLRFPTV